MKKRWFALVLSVLFPGLGFFYLGRSKKGFLYLGLYLALLIASSSFPILFLLALGCWIYNIYDAVRDSKMINSLSV